MDFILIRHAQPQWVVDGTARNDPDLTDLGRRQADAVGKAVAHVDFDQLWVSPAARSQQTAAAIVAHHDTGPDATTVRTCDWALEIQFPPGWDEAPAEQVEAWLRTSRHQDRDQWWEASAPHGGESFRDFHERVTTGLDAELATLGIDRMPGESDLYDMDADDRSRIGLITHAGTNSVVLTHLLGLDTTPWEWERFSSAHASISLLRHRPIANAAIFGLWSFSETSHLTDVGITR